MIAVLLLCWQHALSILSHNNIPGVLAAGVCGPPVRHSDPLWWKPNVQMLLEKTLSSVERP